jgi:hypothetical protein
MTDKEYFSRPEVSNSTLSELKRQLSGREFDEPVEAYAFGSLLDAMITEPRRVNFIEKTFDGLPAANFDVAKQMAKAFSKEDVSKSILKFSDFQKVSITRRQMEYNGVSFELDCRCKWDFFGHISGDIKSTAATSQKQFVAACHHFDYFRSRAWYMDIDNTKRDVIIGISKVNFKVFYVPIWRGDNLYELGRQQYTELAFKYWALQEYLK